MLFSFYYFESSTDWPVDALICLGPANSGHSVASYSYEKPLTARYRSHPYVVVVVVVIPYAVCVGTYLSIHC